MVIKRILYLICFLAVWLIICVCGALEKIIYQKRCYDNSLHVFYTQTAFTLDECISECQLRTRCFGTRYNNHYKHCSLLDPVDLDRLQDQSPGCLFTNISQWEHQNLGSCAGHNCSMSEVCVPVNPTDHECMTSYCEEPPVVANARTIVGKQLLGSRNRYICNVGFTRIGDPVVTCQDDGQWTETDVYCVKQCRRPKADYFNSYLIGTDIVNNFAPGTTLYFRCREGFQSAGTETSNTCDTNSRWTRGAIIQCCSDVNHYYQGRCFMPFGNSTVSSIQGKSLRVCIQNTSNLIPFVHVQQFWLDTSLASIKRKTCIPVYIHAYTIMSWYNYHFGDWRMRSHCQRLGGRQGNVYTSYGKQIEATGVAYDLLINAWQKQQFKWFYNLTSNCLVPNFGSDLGRFTNMAYDDIVHYVKDNFETLDTRRNGCYQARLWGPDQEPDGGDSEPCIFLRKSNGYKGYGDTSCNFQNLNVGFVCHFQMDGV
ncbi:uncharacterized protein LOC128217465 [Mya arenaria]|uniref:uncharacterized protein LOC128217465 n=1 Tax=Mya arenaria TaxID=6604 RepID=UPI0022E4ECA5|nr:uncharacterized protein LOC128217465 [Mya arenaria]